MLGMVAVGFVLDCFGLIYGPVWVFVLIGFVFRVEVFVCRCLFVGFICGGCFVVIACC